MTGERIDIDAGELGLAWIVGDDGRLHQFGFGPDALAATLDFPTQLYPLAYPTFGEEHLREPALRVTHADGVTSTRLTYRSHTEAPHDDGIDHRVVLGDRVAPLAVVLCARTWPEVGILEQWVEVTNEGTDPCTLHQAASAAPALRAGDPHLTHWGGGWAHEWTETSERLSMGTKTVASAGGVRSSLHLEPVVLLAPDGAVGERSGRVLAATVAWGGDVRFDAEVAPHGQLRLIAGTQHRGAERILGPGETFVAPPAAWTWSEAGIGPTSRALQRFVRRHVVRDGERLRATVVNTWEATFFDLDPARLVAQVDEAAALGGELFLLDDGWFGGIHPRNDDTTSLGDWVVDETKLPDGLQPLIDHTLERDLRFGLWVEPEMVNPVSELYAAHPDWVIAEPGRERREERNQLVLDLTRPEVAAWCVDTIDRVLAEHPGISYLKWDANRDVTEPGSSHLPIDRVRATWAVMDEVVRRHPDVELMLCASGGGRSDLGTLARFHEQWTSDNTDPIDRVRIQWGASHLLPASVLAAHVTRWGEKPFAFACAVAMSGRFGFDVDLVALAPDEREVAIASAAAYAEIRDLVQQGEHHRLVSPVGSPHGSVAFVDPAGGRAVAFAFALEDGDEPDGGPLEDLDLAGPWSVTEITPGSPGGPTDDVGWPIGPAPAARVWVLSGGSGTPAPAR